MEMMRKIKKAFKYIFCSVSPVYYHSGKTTFYIPEGLRVTDDKPCIIKITNKEKIMTGLGTYYGNGHVLTALHVFTDRESYSTIIVMFPTEEGFLGYKAEVTKYCKTYPDRDQAFLQLLGDTDPLGDGLQNQIGRVDENSSGYFYTLSDSDHFKKQECEVFLPSNKNDQTNDGKFLLNRAGRPGDSGSAVFCNGKWVGIYRGANSNDSRTIEYGFGTELDPEMNLLASPANQLHYISVLH